MTFLFSACSKFEDLESQLDGQVEISSIAVFNVVPQSRRIDIALDGISLNAGKDRFEYGKYLPFRNWPAGTKSVDVTSYYNGGVKEDTYRGTIDLVGGQIYSLFVYKDSKLGIVQSRDDIIKPDKGYAKIRVVHMSSDAPPLMIRDSNGKALYESEVKYKDVTGFVTVNLTDLRLFGDAKDMASALEMDYSFTPANQEIYTLLIRGRVKSTDESDEFEVELIKH